jgi:hypothetical protein
MSVLLILFLLWISPALLLAPIFAFLILAGSKRIIAFGEAPERNPKPILVDNSDVQATSEPSAIPAEAAALFTFNDAHRDRRGEEISNDVLATSR